MVHVIITAFGIAFASLAIANPKCSHRLASSTNDLFKDTNPVKERVAKVAVKAGPSQSAKGTR